MATKQKTAVVNTILSVLKERGVDYELGGEVTVKSILEDDDKAKVRAIILEGLMAGEIEMSESARAKHDDEAKMRVYTNGLINNWIKKNPDFNCGNKYKPANPGSRTGSQDEQIREMRKLLKQTDDPEVIEMVNKSINERLAELKPESVVTIDASKLPEHLRKLVK